MNKILKLGIVLSFFLMVMVFAIGTTNIKGSYDVDIDDKHLDEINSDLDASGQSSDDFANKAIAEKAQNDYKKKVKVEQEYIIDLIYGQRDLDVLKDINIYTENRINGLACDGWV